MSKKIADDAGHMDNTELLVWAMNQLFRAARILDLAAVGGTASKDSPTTVGCDGTAKAILKKLVKTKKGWKMVKSCNPQLLRGYKAPK